MKHFIPTVSVVLASIFVFSIDAATIKVTNTGDSSMGGVEEDPIMICTVAELQSVRQNLNAHYQLACDIDLTSVSDFKPIGWRSVPGTFGSSYFLDPFTGIFDGAGHTIKGLNLTRGGLFGVVGKNTLSDETPHFDSRAQIRNLNLTNVNYQLTASNDFVYYPNFPNTSFGIVANENYGTISNVKVSYANVKTYAVSNVGMIAGYVFLGKLLNVSVDHLTYEDFGTYENFSLQPAKNVAGILARGKSATIDGCSVSGSFLSNGSDAGIVSYLSNGSISNCNVQANYTPKVPPSSPYNVGGGSFAGLVDQIVGGSTDQVSISNSDFSGNITAAAASGMVGSHQYGALTIRNVSVNAVLKAVINSNYNSDPYSFSGGMLTGGIGSTTGNLTIQDSYVKGAMDGFPTSSAHPTAPYNSYVTMAGLIGTSVNASQTGLILLRSYVEMNMSHYGTRYGGIVANFTQGTKFQSKGVFFDKTTSGMAYASPGFYNSTTHQYDYPALGLAKTSAQMGQASTYIGAQYSERVWDFSSMATTIINPLGAPNVPTPTLMRR